jgi:hypothetical protein
MSYLTDCITWFMFGALFIGPALRRWASNGEERP